MLIKINDLLKNLAEGQIVPELKADDSSMKRYQELAAGLQEVKE